MIIHNTINKPNYSYWGEDAYEPQFGKIRKRQNSAVSSQDFLESIGKERKDFLLYVKTADCMPLFFWSHTHPLIGILHSGWKGTRDGITQKMIAHIRHIYPSIGLTFFLGPCIRGYEYEVKEDVSTYFESFISGIMKKEGKIYLGLENVVHEVLNECDIEIDDSNLSTLSHPDYFSHRDKDTGRNINVIRFIP